MAKVKGALFGLKSRGQLGKAMVYAEWRGVQYARSHTVPANPRTEAQQLTRTVFAWLNAYWRFAPAVAKEPWMEFVRGKPLIDRNALIQQNIPALRTALNIADFIASPGTGSAPPLASLAVNPTATAGELQAVASAPTLPAGWSLQRVVFIALRNTDPHETFVETVRALQASASPYQVTFTGLASGQEYLIAAWGVYVKPDGSLAFGPSVNSVGVPA